MRAEEEDEDVGWELGSDAVSAEGGRAAQLVEHVRKDQLLRHAHAKAKQSHLAQREHHAPTAEGRAEQGQLRRLGVGQRRGVATLAGELGERLLGQAGYA